MNADSVLTGKHELSKDNLTEHLNTINIFSRFNIHQELFLAAVYKMYDFGMKPILFYVEFVFSMQGFYMGIIMTLCWVLSGSWLPSILTAAFITCHRYWKNRYFLGSFEQYIVINKMISVCLQLQCIIDFRYLVTRVENTIPLREHWSMPFVFAQFLIVGYYLDYYKRRKTNSREVTM